MNRRDRESQRNFQGRKNSSYRPGYGTGPGTYEYEGIQMGMPRRRIPSEFDTTFNDNVMTGESRDERYQGGMSERGRRPDFSSQYETQYGPQTSGYAGKGPKGYKRSDEKIKEDACEALMRDPYVDASNIEVDVRDACITLSGEVHDRDSKHAAELAVEYLPGVEDVRNEIRVTR